MDVVFRDDLCRLRIGHAPQNMAAIRHIALQLQGKPQGPPQDGRLVNRLPRSHAQGRRLRPFKRFP
jgi:hypothetical protein